MYVITAIFAMIVTFNLNNSTSSFDSSKNNLTEAFLLVNHCY